MQQADVIIIGAGIVGLATALDLTQRFPQRRVIVLEKEPGLALHQTGHNSGVLHSGIYYKPGSLKAVNCREGKRRMEAFCAEEGIEYEICGKVIVAVDQSELPALDLLYQRGQANGVACELIDERRLHELEPHAAGVRAIYVSETGIVNYRQVCERLAKRIGERQGQIVCGARVTDVEQRPDRIVVQSTAGEFAGKFLVNCAGLYCDRVTRLTGAPIDVQIVPFRGEYYQLKPEVQHFCRNLIYPVPDANFPFLGVHFTRMIDGSVECGPNAVLAFAREGYTLGKVNVRDLAESLTYPGFMRLAARHWRMGLGELWRSLSKAAFVRALQRLLPELRAEHLTPAPAGVRAQAVSRDGRLVDDFLFQETDRIVNVLNAPSPAATASLNIGQTIVERLSEHF